MAYGAYYCKIEVVCMLVIIHCGLNDNVYLEYVYNRVICMYIDFLCCTVFSFSVYDDFYTIKIIFKQNSHKTIKICVNFKSCVGTYNPI